MNVFVTGATGFVGQEILQQLMRGGHSIRILARHRQSHLVQRIVGQFGPEVHAGNVLDGNSLERGLNGIDAVIHLVGIISEIGENTFENVHTRGTQNIVTAAQRAGVKRFIHMSALGTRPHAVSRYHKSKWAAEEIVRQDGMAYTIFRPSIIYGPHDQFVNLFAKMARRSPVLPVIGNGRNKFQPVAVEAVATCFVKALNEPKSIGQTFDLCGLEIFTMDEILDQILEVTGRRRPKVHLLLGVARCQAALLGFIFPRLLKKAPPLNRDQIIMLQEDNVGNPQPANELFGLRHSLFKEGISRYLNR